MATAAAVSLYLQLGLRWDSDRPRDFAYIMIVTVGVTTVVWLLVTWMTPAEPEATLTAFYRRVRPHGPGWKPIAARVGEPAGESHSLVSDLVNAALGCVLVYAALFGVGEILLRSVAVGCILLVVSMLAAWAVAKNLREPAQSATRFSSAS